MSWYKNHYSEWKEIIETVARELGKNEIMVEKDTIQSIGSAPVQYYGDASGDYPQQIL